MFSNLAVRILTNTISIYIASKIVPGFYFKEDDFLSLITAGFIFGLINFFIKPVLKIISIPVIFITFGLFTIVINIAMLLLLDYFTPQLEIIGFKAVFYGMIVISVVNFFIGSHSRK